MNITTQFLKYNYIMKTVIISLMLFFCSYANAESCDSFTIQFVSVERASDAEKRLGTIDFDLINDTKHSLMQYRYNKGNEQIEKTTLAEYYPAASGLELNKEFPSPATVRAFFNIRTDSETIDVVGVTDVADANRYEGTSKAQILGLLTQLDNLINNGADTTKAVRSVADLYGKADEVKHELAIIRKIINRAN